jgi:Asp-tRNA(Asn)/Glu-tRNA(Gln) amidotransferase C subunit
MDEIQIKHLARLSEIQLTDEEVEELKKEFDTIL